ncbi:GntR family transcriptional regulator [Micromonospora sp. NPDC047730]|uniref:GntR family transcriptional regulator n=1 Tax=Micromonospora sp. NPDC047730 TaxID=3364253 RepID=UPI003718226B
MSPADPARYRQIADSLRSRIESGELPAGFTLPGEVTLAEEYGVARGTLQRALETLRAEGLIETIVGRGTQVRARQPVQELGPDRYRAGWGDRLTVYNVDRSPATADLAERLRVEVGTPLLWQRSVHYVDDRPRRLETSHIPLELVDGREDMFGAAKAGDNVAQLAAAGIHVDEIWESPHCRLATEAEAAALMIPGVSRVTVIARWMTVGDLRVETADIVMPADQVRPVYRVTP